MIHCKKVTVQEIWMGFRRAYWGDELSKKLWQPVEVRPQQPIVQFSSMLWSLGPSQNRQISLILRRIFQRQPLFIVRFSQQLLCRRSPQIYYDSQKNWPTFEQQAIAAKHVFCLLSSAIDSILSQQVSLYQLQSVTPRSHVPPQSLREVTTSNTLHQFSHFANGYPYLQRKDRFGNITVPSVIIGAHFKWFDG